MFFIPFLVLFVNILYNNFIKITMIFLKLRGVFLKDINKTMMQYFEWYIKPEEELWKKVISEASFLSSIGITSLWLPPAYKGAAGINDTGYGVYDMYDLGEFQQKDTIRTKYGTKDEYLEAIKVLQANNIQVIADTVFNHRMGADELEDVIAFEDDPYNRNTDISDPKTIKAWTKFTFPGRNNTYSTFKWNWTHFHGVDWDETTSKKAIYKFYGKHWDEEVDKENGNFDYLMGADVDLNNVDVVNELLNWAKWYLHFTHVDGLRLDAVKHIRSNFFKNFLEDLQTCIGKKIFTIGEYWSANLEALTNYLKEINESMYLFDVPLHYNLYNASNSNGNYDMRTILDGSLVKSKPELAITFVDNHDTEPGQSLESYLQDWFKPIAYSIILLRKDGIPCIFYGDYYGIKEKNIEPKKEILQKLLNARKYFAYGKQNDYLDDANIIGWTREGDIEHKDSGMAVILSDNAGGSKIMNVGKRLAGSILYDYTGNVKENVYIDNEGNGIFYCNGGSVSVWVKKENIYN